MSFRVNHHSEKFECVWLANPSSVDAFRGNIYRVTGSICKYLFKNMMW